MKIRTYSFFRRCGYGMAALLALVVCGISAYALFFRPQLPECQATLWVTNQLKDKTMRRVLLISIAPEGARRAKVLIHGSFFDGYVRYNIDRAVIMDYQRQGDNYTFTVRENNNRPADSLIAPELNRRMPMQGQQYHLRIEQIDSQRFLFVGNYAPLFVCSAVR